MTANVVIRKGKPEDADHFSRLVLLTSPTLLPALFGSNVKNLMQKLFRHKRNYYSFERSFFIEVDGNPVGMAFLHKLVRRRRDKFHIIFLLLKNLKLRFFTRAAHLLKSDYIIRKAAGDDCYLSNIAVYPEFRSLGLGTKLIQAVENEVRDIGKRRIVLNAETHNKKAISLYERLGYRIEKRSPALRIRNKVFESFKLCKQIS
jgi:GNAT superfamily N-acetyltransferase